MVAYRPPLRASSSRMRPLGPHTSTIQFARKSDTDWARTWRCDLMNDMSVRELAARHQRFWANYQPQIRGAWFASKPAAANAVMGLKGDVGLGQRKGWITTPDPSLAPLSDRVLFGHTGSVLAAIAMRDGRFLSMSDDRSMCLWSPNGAQLATFEGHRAPVAGAIELSDCILSCDHRGEVRSWTLDGDPLDLLGAHHASTPHVVAATDVGLLTYDRAGARLWRPDHDVAAISCEEGDLIKILVDHAGRVLAIHERIIRIWRPDTGAANTINVPTHGALLAAAVLHPSRLAVWDDLGALFLCDLDASSCMLAEGGDIALLGAAPLEGGQFIAWGEVGVQICDAKGAVTHNKRLPLAGGAASSTGGIFWEDDGQLHLWRSGRMVRLERRASSALALSDGRFVIWRMGRDAALLSENGVELANLEGHSSWINHFAELPDGRLVSSSTDCSLRLWPYISSPLPLEQHREAIHTTSRNKRHLLSVSSDSARLWRADGAVYALLSGEEHAPLHGAMALEDQRFLTWGDQGLWLWSHTGRSPRRIDDPRGKIIGAVSGDGAVLYWNSSGHLFVWPLDGAPIGLQYFSSGVRGAAVLSAQRYLTWSAGRVAILWTIPCNPGLDKEATPLAGHRGAWIGAAELADGGFVSWCDAGELRLWSAMGEPHGAIDGSTQHVIRGVHVCSDAMAAFTDGDLILGWPDAGASKPKILHKLDGARGVHLNRAEQCVAWSRPGIISISSLRTGKTRVIKAHQGPVEGVAALDETRFVSWGRDATLRVWSMDGQELGMWISPTGSVATPTVLNEETLAVHAGRRIALLTIRPSGGLVDRDKM